MEIANFNAFDGQHCETTATGTLLIQLGITLSEPMLFGLGEGLGFIVWPMKSMPFLFIGGRIKPDILTKNLAKNLKLELTVKETSSQQKAWVNVKRLIDEGTAVGLKLDCFYLDYFSNPFHFAGHYAALYGYDDEFAYLVDTKQQGGKVKTSLSSLALARSEKGPMSSKNLYYTLRTKSNAFDLEKAVRESITRNAFEYINPPISNIGYRGILKTATEISKLFETTKNIEHTYRMIAMLMEKAGTGGALFRNLYRDFLKQSYELIKIEKLQYGYEEFVEIAKLWTLLSELFAEVSETTDRQHIEQSAEILTTLALKERNVMEVLTSI